METESGVASTHTGTRMSTRSEVVEVVTRGERRRAWSDEQKGQILTETLQPGAVVAEVARRWGIGTGLIYTWRRQMRDGTLGAMPTPAPVFAEVSVAPSPATAEVAPPAPTRQVPVETGDGGLRRIEIALPCGVTVRVGHDVDEAALRRVLSAVRAG
jgi:transposase